MRVISNDAVIIIVSEWFEENYDLLFNEKPKSYKVSVDKEDWVMVAAIFEGGSSDFAGVGNKYKFLW